MRTIKFRGKSLKTGEWFYGNLFDKDTHGRTHICTTHKGCLCIAPDTVGQFTGLKDKNGKEIYEGDIVKACSEGKYRICQVIWSEERTGFFLRHPSGPWSLSGAWGNETAEIIGNIHDNPELITNNEK